MSGRTANRIARFRQRIDKGDVIESPSGEYVLYADYEQLAARLRTARGIVIDVQNFIHPTSIWRDEEAMQRVIDKFLDEVKP